MAWWGRTMGFLIVRRVLGILGLGRSPDAKDIEIAVLHHQIAVLRRQVTRPQFTAGDRLVLVTLSRFLAPSAVGGLPGHPAAGSGVHPVPDRGRDPQGAPTRPYRTPHRGMDVVGAPCARSGTRHRSLCPTVTHVDVAFPPSSEPRLGSHTQRRKHRAAPAVEDGCSIEVSPSVFRSHQRVKFTERRKCRAFRPQG